MITKTAKEIYRNAQSLAQTFATDYESFEFATDYINTLYRELYDYIVASPMDYYVHKQTISKNDTELNDDVYQIKSVRVLSKVDNSFQTIQRQPSNTYVAGTYTIEDNKLHYNGDLTNPIEVRYAPQPLTITMPFDRQEMSVNPDEVGKMLDDGIYYKENGNELFYDFKSQTSTSASSYKEAPSTDKPDYVEDQESVYGEATAWFEDEDYTVASYKDGTILIFQNGTPAIWNINASTGHSTKGTVYGLRTDDTTGYGLVYYDNRDEAYYYAPFVPDTVMSYPTNTFFHLMELRLAIMLASLNNLDTQYLSNEERKAEQTFASELRKDRQTLRVNNIYSKRGYAI